MLHGPSGDRRFLKHRPEGTPRAKFFSLSNPGKNS
nr:MAG TPA: hypothetical protein [Caudoviricetes sp.]